MRRALLTGALAALAVAGCGRGTHPAVVRGASPSRGHDLIVHYGCGTCHRIGGVSGANGAVGPSLRDFSNDRFLAGQLPNDPANAVRWIMHPQRVQPNTLMPNLGLDRQQALDVVAYLYTQ